MIAGRLDRRIALQQASTITDDFGGEEPTWADLATVWASKQDVKDAERVAAAEVGATITTRFQVRYSTATARLTEKDQLVCEGRTYAIQAIKEIGRRAGIEISAVARAE